MSRVSKALVDAREAAGLTRQQLAERWCGEDRHRVRSRASMIERWERGERAPSPVNAATYAMLCASQTHDGATVRAAAAHMGLLVMLADVDTITDLYGRAALSTALATIRGDILYRSDSDE